MSRQDRGAGEGAAESAASPTGTMRAGDLKVGAQVAERDGYLFTVTEIVRETRATITVKLACKFSPMPEVRAGIQKTLRKSSLLRVAAIAEEASS